MKDQRGIISRREEVSNWKNQLVDKSVWHFLDFESNFSNCILIFERDEL
jgi:hypothetical protein